MSEGNKGSEGGNLNSKIRRIDSSGSDDLGRQISKIAVSQICESVGFHSAHRSAIETLAQIATRFVVELGKTSHFYANLSGRTSCNEFDITQGLKDLGSAHAHHCLVGSRVVREITQFVSSQAEMPFAQLIPSFPIVRRSCGEVPSFWQIGEEPQKKYIPNWLPAFPDAHTYVRTLIWNERASDAKSDKIEQARQRRKVEKSLLSLQKRLACNGMSDGVDEKGKQIVGNNPFLAPALLVGEKDVSESAALSEMDDLKRVSVLETFVPVIDEVKSGSFERGVEERRVLSKRSPTVHFKFGIEKNVAVPISSKVVGVKSKSWFLRDDEKDDKKRRAETILKEAMENPQELMQL